MAAVTVGESVQQTHNDPIAPESQSVFGSEPSYGLQLPPLQYQPSTSDFIQLDSSIWTQPADTIQYIVPAEVWQLSAPWGVEPEQFMQN